MSNDTDWMMFGNSGFWVDDKIKPWHFDDLYGEHNLTPLIEYEAFGHYPVFSYDRLAICQANSDEKEYLLIVEQSTRSFLGSHVDNFHRKIVKMGSQFLSKIVLLSKYVEQKTSEQTAFGRDGTFITLNISGERRVTLKNWSPDPNGPSGQFCSILSELQNSVLNATSSRFSSKEFDKIEKTLKPKINENLRAWLEFDPQELIEQLLP